MNHSHVVLYPDCSCGCPGSTTSCPLCEDGTFDAEFPGRHIPLSVPGIEVATCQDVIDLLIFHDENVEDTQCKDLKEYGGYCGCPNPKPLNECSFCPGGESPTNKDLVVSSFYTCEELDLFVSYMDSGRCSNTDDLELIRNFAYVCGCPNTEPSCTLCPEGNDPINGSEVASDDGRTCKDYARQVETFTDAMCNDFEFEITGIAAGPCDCGGEGVDFPRCQVQENEHLCTKELLGTVDPDEECACYAFCDGEFVRCQTAQGGILREDECPGTRVTGCNMAGAEEAMRNESGAAHPIGAFINMFSWSVLATILCSI